MTPPDPDDRDALSSSIPRRVVGSEIRHSPASVQREIAEPCRAPVTSFNVAHLSYALGPQ